MFCLVVIALLALASAAAGIQYPPLLAMAAALLALLALALLELRGRAPGD